MSKLKDLIRKSVRELRGHVIFNSYQGNWDKPKHHGCELCNATWKPRTREKHKPTCLLAQAYKAIGMQPPRVRVRPLRGGK